MRPGRGSAEGNYAVTMISIKQVIPHIKQTCFAITDPAYCNSRLRCRLYLVHLSRLLHMREGHVLWPRGPSRLGRPDSNWSTLCSSHWMAPSPSLHGGSSKIEIYVRSQPLAQQPAVALGATLCSARFGSVRARVQSLPAPRPGLVATRRDRAVN